MFAWPETALLGERPATSALTVTDLRGEAVTNRFPDQPGCAVEFRCESAPRDRVLVLDANGTVQGLAIAIGTDGVFRGWVRGAPTSWRIAVAR